MESSRLSERVFSGMMGPTYEGLAYGFPDQDKPSCKAQPYYKRRSSDEQRMHLHHWLRKSYNR